MEDLGIAGKDYGMGGHQPKGLRIFFQGGSAGGAFIRVRDVDDDPLRGKGPGDLPAQGQ